MKYLFMVLFVCTAAFTAHAADRADWQKGKIPTWQIQQGKVFPVYHVPLGSVFTYLSETHSVQTHIKDHPVLFYAGLTQPTGRYPVTLGVSKEPVAWIEVVKPDWPEQVLTLDIPKYNSYEPDELIRIKKETREIRNLFLLRTPVDSIHLRHPLSKPQTGGRFGSRRVINGNPGRRHTGADYSVPAGTPVLATADGTVVLSDEHFFAGNSVFVDHGGGWLSMYFHLQKALVAPGQKVKQGTPVGLVGSTGRSTGPHLHFGFRYRGQVVDPGQIFALFKDAQKD